MKSFRCSRASVEVGEGGGDVWCFVIWMPGKTCQTQAMSAGFQQVTLSRPVPVPPIPRYPCRFANLWQALTSHNNMEEADIIRDCCHLEVCYLIQSIWLHKNVQNHSIYKQFVASGPWIGSQKRGFQQPPWLKEMRVPDFQNFSPPTCFSWISGDFLVE